MEDITFRALNILRESDVIAAEDTRQTLKLLNHYGIKKKLISYYEHNKIKQGNYLIKLLLEGKNIALVSDAGTPGISDPGEDLIKLAIEEGIKVVAAPGPTAAITGLVVSGLPTNRFVFEGFLPMNKKSRKERLSEIKKEFRTMVLYEAPHKLRNTLNELFETLGNRKIVIARELTKKFEEVIRCTLKEAVEIYKEKTPKGEYVLILEGYCVDENIQDNINKWEGIPIKEHLDYWIKNGLSRKEALKKVAEERSMSRREVYDSIIKDKDEICEENR
ncbi:MAG TPA: 16S rRNA (cytidine(1402)-2'-O)-methyltransferase [Clostridiaceae bacterium]|nr:16S rRNA (cytidine(1402)-2'-O)-methyltransferase [Clostridiaceae bacterium]